MLFILIAIPCKDQCPTKVCLPGSICKFDKFTCRSECVRKYIFLLQREKLLSAMDSFDLSINHLSQNHLSHLSSKTIWNLFTAKAMENLSQSHFTEHCILREERQNKKVKGGKCSVMFTCIHIYLFT